MAPGGDEGGMLDGEQKEPGGRADEGPNVSPTAPVSLS
jgi:hypothetical protein